MKKSKIIAPIITAVGIVGSAAPLSTLVSCSKNKINTIYLGTGQKADRSISIDNKLVTYRFVQKNIKYPEDTKLTIYNFAVNGVYHRLWANTFRYRTDSAGNIVLNINTAAIRSSMSNDVDEISFNILFKNTKANSKHYIGTFHIKYDLYQKINLTIEDDLESKFKITHKELAPMSSIDPIVLNITPEDGKYVHGINLKTTSGQELEAGKDYTFVLAGNQDPKPGTEATYVINVINCSEDVILYGEIVQSTVKPFHGIRVLSKIDESSGVQLAYIDETTGLATGVTYVLSSENGFTSYGFAFDEDQLFYLDEFDAKVEDIINPNNNKTIRTYFGRQSTGQPEWQSTFPNASGRYLVTLTGSINGEELSSSLVWETTASDHEYDDIESSDGEEGEEGEEGAEEESGEFGY